MTLPVEELSALKRTREFLRDMLGSNLTTIRKNAREIRERAGRCLKHYPFDMHIDSVWEKRIEEHNRAMREFSCKKPK
ncbi:MAG: hypothetical protein GF334_05050 [Candidatus Altiarchaeales archaeon]|nr:hypothetical protein [Candidatus Altiarchaeales archaeon]